ncbi:MAG: winged helix-turn-helix transcriptional regulator [Deltaproteobacteria bacterium]|nr:winged helix-turn-helix transcriptional regulator [Deltaproteobacteria bacterium]MBI2342042.1 winged helix-turn-helix transcriptional regulator [Deltaproteobacteria bacterium]MBI2974450.1 winged helix-turn-helix transcriptional regulator [Deltaproteobacteria bacterium]
MCKALGNPIRMKIFEHLKEADKCICGEIVNILPIAQATVSQHLKVLKTAGLIKGAICGPSTCYCINKDALDEFKKMVKEF